MISKVPAQKLNLQFKGMKFILTHLLVSYTSGDSGNEYGAKMQCQLERKARRELEGKKNPVPMLHPPPRISQEVTRDLAPRFCCKRSASDRPSYGTIQPLNIYCYLSEQFLFTLLGTKSHIPLSVQESEFLASYYHSLSFCDCSSGVQLVIRFIGNDQRFIKIHYRAIANSYTLYFTSACTEFSRSAISLSVLQYRLPTTELLPCLSHSNS